MIVIQPQINTDFVYDAGPIGCGELIMNVFLKMKTLQPGQVMEVISYDLGAVEDIPAWCRMQGHTLLYSQSEGLMKTHFFIKKGEN
ncbi:tRNA 2-thiouridine synthesizing protein A [Evansella vedderi]|uniref:tRNA 2-thiouridine synthesizing protein A n=1 Tax=Evansella vedderi TaxID=38282 RepID=A0ABT9ZVL4_9BACI|nr:sulfurtransferase TusA family protein [Evansella vedderi]MDQ0255276.1 tRNA 2-thiouridine synthesizing protein A [Evansella vedderi]